MGMRWWRREWAVESVLAAGLGAVAAFGVVLEVDSVARPTPPSAGGVVLALATAATLVWRRRRPVLTATVAIALEAVYHLLGYPGGAPLIVLYVSVYSMAAYGATRRAIAGAFAVCAAAYVIQTLPPHPYPWTGGEVYWPALAMGWVALLGVGTRRRRLEADDRVRRAAAVAEAEVRQRLAEERLRIARDLHDVLAHTISVITVQGANALDALDRDTGAAREALVTIRAASRQALSELRATLGPLRDGGAHDPPPPQPDLAGLPDLVAPVEAAGVRVTLDVEAPGGLPPVVELTAYRIVQEALTNVVRHARARSAAVTVRLDGDALLVRVCDDGSGPLETGGGAGLGLVGMRERVEALGGRVSAGPQPAGGYRVSATLPL
jgi:signal transduction histidine kinase